VGGRPGGLPYGDAVRERLGALASRLYPGLDERIFNRKQDRLVRELVRRGAVEDRLADHPVRPHAPERDLGRDSHLFVVPQNGVEDPTWHAAGGNFLYEIAQAAREYAGAGKVTVFNVRPNEAPEDWHVRLIRELIESGATHLIAQVEADPHRTAVSWTWDAMWAQLLQRWDGVFLGVMFDSSWPWLTIQSRRLASMSSRFMVVDICMPMDGVLVPGRPEVGPVNMPVSHESLAVIDAYVDGMTRDFTVTILGSLYPERSVMIDAVERAGVAVAVNPHRPDETTTLLESRANQPTYLDYMAGLARSEMTINFSRSSAGPYLQLKTRVLEASAMGCLVLTDDVDRTSRFFAPDEEYAYFGSPEQLADVVADYLGDRDRLRRAQDRARAKARAICVTSFWGGIEDGLLRRGLPGFAAS